MAPMAAERAARLGGRTVRWLEGGRPNAARTLIWLHAFPLSAEMWRPQLDAAPAGWRVVAPDLAGLGGTDDTSGPPTVDDFARDAALLADHLGVDRFVLGGLSMGGYATFAGVRLFATRLEAVVLADTKAGADSAQAREGRARMLSLVASDGVGAVASEMLPKLLGGTTQRDEPGLVSLVKGLIDGNSARGVARAIERLRDRPDSTPMLSTLDRPALILVGEEDGITPAAEARAMHSAIRGSTLALIPRAGHLANLEAPVAFNAAVASFLAAV
jgi:pimeloyl-ACP methyl ester carboxylesterase